MNGSGQNSIATRFLLTDPTNRMIEHNLEPAAGLAIESVSIGIVIADASQPDWPIIFCNSAFERITGYSSAEILGHNCRILQQDDRSQPARDAIRTALKNRQECTALLRNYRKDGTLFWNELTISPVKNTAGETTHYVGLVNDVTERIAAEEEKLEREARLHAILNTAVEAIVTIDDHGMCESLNPAAEAMFGYDAEEVIGQNISLLMPSPYHEQHDQYIADYLRTGKKKIIGIGREATGRRKNGEEFSLHIAVNEVQLAGHRIFTGFLQDLTEQKEAQHRLVQSERLAVLGEAMARLAHESRNSLQRIQIAVEIARLHSETNQALADQLDLIERASDGLDSLLDEVKNYAAPLILDENEASLDRIWREAWQATAPSRVGREATLLEQIDTPHLVGSVDRFRLGQVFRNLFENSLAACDDPVQVKISVSETAGADGKAWKFRVLDNGPGFDHEQAARLFEPFFTTKVKGTGLGMSIAYRIIEAHGGKISIGSMASQGAELLIELPQHAGTH